MSSSPLCPFAPAAASPLSNKNRTVVLRPRHLTRPRPSSRSPSRITIKCSYAASNIKEDFSSVPIDVVADVKTEKVVVLGGNGFVGSAICKAAVSKGIEVVSLSRSGKPAYSESWVDQVTWVAGDVFYVRWGEVLVGATAVVSTIGGFGSEDQMKRINGEANILAIDAAKDFGIPKFIMISVHDYNLPSFLLSSGYFTGKRKAESELLAKYPNSANMSSNLENDTSEEIRAERREQTIRVVCAVTMQAILDDQRILQRQALRDSSYTGMIWVTEVLNHPHPARCHEAFRMEAYVFRRLCLQLRDVSNLSDTKRTCVEEQVAIFMGVVGHNYTNRESQERLQHSGETISRYFRRVLKAVLCWSKTIITPPPFDQVHTHISDNRKYYPHFKDCIGAIDGTHIDARVPMDMQPVYRNRKGDTTQNVLAVCDFDMRFTFAFAGWEGSAHDARVLQEALDREDINFPVAPSGKYYLVDAGYPNRPGFLAPYRGVRYHLQDFRRSGAARTEKEIFNHAHSSLRNIIERCFGVLKARFPILSTMGHYSLETQRDIVIACMTIHNFIRQEQIADQFEQLYGPDYVVPNPDDNDEVGSSSAASRRPMDAFRAQLSQLIKARSNAGQLGL